MPHSSRRQRVLVCRNPCCRNRCIPDGTYCGLDEVGDVRLVGVVGNDSYSLRSVTRCRCSVVEAWEQGRAGWRDCGHMAAVCLTLSSLCPVAPIWKRSKSDDTKLSDSDGVPWISDRAASACKSLELQCRELRRRCDRGAQKACLPSGTACKKGHTKLQWPIVLVVEVAAVLVT